MPYSRAKTLHVDAYLPINKNNYDPFLERVFRKF